MRLRKTNYSFHYLNKGKIIVEGLSYLGYYKNDEEIGYFKYKYFIKYYI